MSMTVYAAAQIQRVQSRDPAMTDWVVDLGAGRTGRVQLPLDVVAAVEATDRDAYVREALADQLTRLQPPAAELLTGTRVAAL
jgi:hypothetical protein